MKYAVFALIAIVSFSGCTKNYPQVTQVYSALYQVSASQWAPGTDLDGTKFFYTSLQIDELTQNIDVNGGVLVYLSFDDPTTANPIYEAMPEVINNVAYGVIHTTGSITVDLRAADGSDMNTPIGVPTLIKVVLMDAQPLGN